MASRRVQRWVWWLLPLLVARALLPMGFMAQTSDGRLQIVLCKSGFASSAWLDARTGQLAEASATDSKSSDTQHSSDRSDDHPCLFAHATATPLLHVAGGELIDVFSASYIPTISEPPYLAVGPPRFIATRGPPAYA